MFLELLLMMFHGVSALIVLFVFQVHLKWPEPFPAMPVVIHQVRAEKGFYFIHK